MFGLKRNFLIIKGSNCPVFRQEIRKENHSSVRRYLAFYLTASSIVKLSDGRSTDETNTAEPLCTTK